MVGNMCNGIVHLEQGCFVLRGIASLPLSTKSHKKIDQFKAKLMSDSREFVLVVFRQRCQNIPRFNQVISYQYYWCPPIRVDMYA